MGRAASPSSTVDFGFGSRLSLLTFRRWLAFIFRTRVFVERIARLRTICIYTFRPRVTCRVSPRAVPRCRKATYVVVLSVGDASAAALCRVKQA